jgi:hypothetical protein
MKFITRILTTLLLAGLSISFVTIETKLKDGYYTSSHGHATVLYKIDGDNVEWYLDNVIKSWGQGKYEIRQTDSVMRISLTRLKTSRQGEFENKDFDYSIEVTWDSVENLLKLKDFRYNDNFDMIDDLKRRVKSSCKIRVERPSR